MRLVSRVSQLPFVKTILPFNMAENPSFAGRIGGVQKYTVNRDDPDQASLLERAPDAAPNLTLRESFRFHQFTQPLLWKAAAIEGVATMLLVYITTFVSVNVTSDKIAPIHCTFKSARLHRNANLEIPARIVRQRRIPELVAGAQLLQPSSPRQCTPGLHRHCRLVHAFNPHCCSYLRRAPQPHDHLRDLPDTTYHVPSCGAIHRVPTGRIESSRSDASSIC